MGIPLVEGDNLREVFNRLMELLQDLKCFSSFHQVSSIVRIQLNALREWPQCPFVPFESCVAYSRKVVADFDHRTGLVFTLIVDWIDACHEKARGRW